MSEFEQPGSARQLSTAQRRTRLMSGLAAVCLLLVSATLRPDPRNYGTHEQLGLPPCTFAAWFHMRCPSCGMTTSWAYATHGDLARAVRVHTTGTLLAGLAGIGGLLLLAEAAAGRALATWRGTIWGPAATAGLGIAVLLEWVVRLSVGL